ncbi:GNAT family N-acetyltransferase [bacterium]|nr:GNAT family N-acetyltransferase [bacterium]
MNNSNSIKVITTYLEMFEKPKFFFEQKPGTSVIRAEKPTVSFYRYLYNTVGASWLWVDRRKMKDVELRTIIQDPKIEVNVLYVGGTPAGYAELDLRQPGEIELGYFGLIPDFVGQGLGKYLLTWAVDAAWKKNPKRFWVHTCSLDHPTALPLYQKCGFTIYKTEEHYDGSAHGRLVSMNVIRCTEKHAAVIAPLFDAYRGFYHQTSDITGAEKFLSDRLKNSESIVFVALDDSGKALGFVQLYPSFSSVSIKKIWILNDLFVIPEARKKGVGEALMETARKFAVETHAKGLQLETGIENITAQRLYEKLGYVRNVETHQYFLKV